MTKLQQVQKALDVVDDDIWGAKSQAALDMEIAASIARRVGSSGWQTVKASSFADPSDVVAFKKCKASGKSDRECFKVGDNGIGMWGHNTAQDHTPMCALPREVWGPTGKKGGAKLEVRYKGISAVGILGDTMPALKNIHNGAGIDLNPAFAKRLGLKPPFMVSGVQWRWV